ncbi:radical SAM protein [Candidatus Peregrinibacteria bacterium]|nr:radical SAM protein [Candidatus Peregrinibacteria bacterium]
MEKSFVDVGGHTIIKSANLNLVTTRSCNARCTFCYDNITFAGQGEYLEPDDEMLLKVLQLCTQVGIQKVVFTGGEPTIDPEKLLALVKVVAPQFSTKRRLYSNGFGLFADVNGKPLIEHLAGQFINKLTISRAHQEQEKNRSIMRAREVVEADEIRRIADMQEKTRFEVTLSAYLTPEGLFSSRDIDEYVKFGESLGVENFVFHAGGFVADEFRKDTPESVLHHKIGETVDIDLLVDELTKERGYKASEDRHDFLRHAHKLTNGNSTITIQQSFKPEKEKDRRIYRIVLGPDRVPRSSWVDQNRVIEI